MILSTTLLDLDRLDPDRLQLPVVHEVLPHALPPANIEVTGGIRRCPAYQSKERPAVGRGLGVAVDQPDLGDPGLLGEGEDELEPGGATSARQAVSGTPSSMLAAA